MLRAQSSVFRLLAITELIPPLKVARGMLALPTEAFFGHSN